MITLRLDKELERTIDSRAKLEGVTRSQLIRKSLLSYFSLVKNRNPYDAGKDYFGRYSAENENLSEDAETILRKKIKAKFEKDNR